MENTDTQEFQKNIAALSAAQQDAATIQRQLEASISLDRLTPEQKEWLLNHRDYLASLDVATIEVKKEPVTATTTYPTVASLVTAWLEVLEQHRRLLGNLSAQLQHFLETGADLSALNFTEGDLRRMQAAIKDVLTSNQWDKKETQALQPALSQINVRVKSGVTANTPEPSQKGFFARLFGK